MKYYIKALNNYSNFGGRATRIEFWAFTFVHLIFAFITIAADHILGTCFKYDLGSGVKLLPFGYIFALYALATLLPTLAVQIRRLHDTGKSGWFLFIVLIPVAGALWLLALYCMAGHSGDNKYDADLDSGDEME